MPPIGSSPSYLIRNQYSYCFRMNVPKDLQPYLSRKELRYSLRTGYVGLAKHKARYLAVQVQILFKSLRKGGLALKSLSDDRVRELVNQYIRGRVDYINGPAYSEDYQKSIPYYEKTGLDLQEIYEMRCAEIARAPEHLNIDMKHGDYTALEKPISDLLKNNGSEDIDTESSEYKQLCHEVYKAAISLSPLELKAFNGDFGWNKDLPALFPEVYSEIGPVAPVKEVDTETSEPLRNVIREYLKEKGRASKTNTNQERKRAVEHFIAFLDNRDVQIHEIDGRMMREYKSYVRDEEIKPGIKRKTSTVNDKYLTFVKGIFRFAVMNSYIDKHPAPELRVEDRHKVPDHEKQDPFSVEDLWAMFGESPEFGEDNAGEAHHFWIPLIALFTGARREEISQLYVTDLVEVDNIWCLAIQEEADKPDKSVKTSEKRLVPLHPFIAKELNFVGFVKRLKGQKGRIFHKLKRTKSGNKYGGAFGQWFSRFRKRCIPNVELGKKTFHSFRHTEPPRFFRRPGYLSQATMAVTSCC